MSRELIVRNPGLLSLIQDAGRSGFQRYGVSVGGAVDQDALLIGNLLVGNDLDAAVIEVMFGGAEFEFGEDAVVAITGADLQSNLDGTPVSMWESFFASAGSILRLVAPISGIRSYLAVAGGIDSSPVLGSRSTHVSSGLGGLSGGPLKTGDRIPIGEMTGKFEAGARLPDELRTNYGNDLMVRVIPGPQQEQFSEAGVKAFYSSSYTVTGDSDRQGLRLDGPQIESIDGRYDIVSDAVVFGAIQVPGDGKPIVLLADRQTTGGYAKIGVAATVDLPLLAQASPGTAIRFVKVDANEAQVLLRKRRKAILESNLAIQRVTTRESLSVNGTAFDVSLSYNSAELTHPGGALVLAEIDGISSTVRVEEIN